MKINVIGATGNLGSRVMDELLKQGASPDQLIASIRSLEKGKFLADKEIELRKADYDDKDSLIEAFKETDILVLIQTFAQIENRVWQLYNAIQAAKINKINRVVSIGFISTSIESKFEIAPFLLYAETKIRQSGLDWTLIRDGLYLDAVVERVPDMIEKGKWTLPAKDVKVSYISRRDLARAIAAVALNEGHSKKTYSLTGSKAYTLEEIASYIAKTTGKQIVYEAESDEDYISRNKGEIPDYLLEAIFTLYRAMESGEFELVTDHVEKITGTPPEHPESYFKRILTK